MKIARPRISILAVALLSSVPVLYWNCSGQIGSPANPGASAENLVPSDGNLHYSAAAGTTGLILALQSRLFTFSPISSDTGPFTVNGLPAWGSFNSSTGQVSGAPVKMSDSGLFSITDTKSGSKFGPYTIQTLGNPLAEFAWHLNNTGQTTFSSTSGVAGEDMHLTSTISRGITGLGVRIAISDSGTFALHEAVLPSLLPGESRNYLNISGFNSSGSWLGDPTPDINTPINAHGTAVASLAVEKGWNGIGSRGIAPDAKFASFLYIQAQDALTQAGLITAATNDQFAGNFDLFNYSWTDPQCQLTQYPQSTLDRLLASVTNQRGGLGSLLLMAAGNYYVDDIQSCNPSAASATVFDNANFSEINSNPYMLTIAAVNANGVSSSYSTPGSNIWVSATGGEYGWNSAPAGEVAQATMPALISADFPGCKVGIKTIESAHSTFDQGQAPNTACNYISTMNGTSGAAPIAAGAMALLLQVNPRLTWRDIKYILAKTADQVDPAANPAQHPQASLNLTGHVYDLGWITNAAGFHFMNYYGFGRIDVDRAVALAQNYVSPLGSFTQTNWNHDSGALNLAIPDGSATGLTQTMSVSENLTLEAVQIRASISACPGDMGLELISPSGTKSVLMNINSEIQDLSMANHTFMSNAFYGESSKGTWTFTVIDGHAGCTGNLTNWKMNFVGY